MTHSLLAFTVGGACATLATAAVLTVASMHAGAPSAIAPMAVAPQATLRDGPTVDRKTVDGAFIAKLVGHLRGTPGCLGVDLGQFQSGKGVIFAWFANRDAAMKFYDSEIHQEAIDRSGFERTRGTPMEGIANDDGPIMIVATAKPGAPDPAKPERGPTLELAIEMYSALPGGVRLGGGGFAPQEFMKLAHERNTAAAAPTTPADAAPTPAK